MNVCMHACQHTNVLLLSLFFLYFLYFILSISNYSSVSMYVRCTYGLCYVLSYAVFQYYDQIWNSKYLQYFRGGHLHPTMEIFHRTACVYHYKRQIWCSILKWFCVKFMRSNAPCRLYVIRSIYAKWFLICRDAVVFERSRVAELIG